MNGESRDSRTQAKPEWCRKKRKSKANMTFWKPEFTS